MEFVLVTNNPIMGSLHLPKVSYRFMECSALLILQAGRDLIHKGWELLHHPLYGNYRPHQQPYRTLILEYKKPLFWQASDKTGLESSAHDAPASPVLNLASLNLIEEALNIFQSMTVLVPEQTPASMQLDCSVLDFELLRQTLQHVGWVESPLADEKHGR